MSEKTKGDTKWSFLFRAKGGGRYFKDAAGRIATCDDTGEGPVTPMFFVETSKPVLMCAASASVPVRSESGELFSVLESAAGGILVAERLGMAIKAGDRTFVLSEVITIKKYPTALLAGPEIGGENTVPHRVVLLRWPDGEFSVHTQRLEGSEWSLEAFSDGDYFKSFSRAEGKFRVRSGTFGGDNGLLKTVQGQLNEMPLCLLAQLYVQTQGSEHYMLEEAMSPTHDPKRKSL